VGKHSECHFWRLTFIDASKPKQFVGHLWGQIGFSTILEVRLCEFAEQKWSGRWDSNPQPPTWEGKYSALYFQHLKNRSEKMYVHALHTVHAVPDLRIAAGRFAGRFLKC